MKFKVSAVVLGLLGLGLALWVGQLRKERGGESALAFSSVAGPAHNRSLDPTDPTDPALTPAPTTSPQAVANPLPVAARAMTIDDFAAWMRLRHSPAADVHPPGPRDIFVRGEIVQDPSGQTTARTAIVRRPGFKYPLIRIEERRDPNSGLLSLNEMVADHLLVRLRPGRTPEELASALGKFGVAKVTPQGTRRVARVSIPLEPPETFERALGALAARPDLVSSRSPDYLVGANAPLIPNDTSFNLQWGMHNTGQSSGTADADIDAPEAWGNSTGPTPTVVALIDSGIDYTHTDLSTKLWANPGESGDGKETNRIDDDGNGLVDDHRGWDFVNGDNDPMDDNQHGTHVAGIIGAASNNGAGVAGVCWNVRFMPLKFLNDNLSGVTSDAALALEYALDHGARLSNNSWGGGAPSDVFYELLEAAAEADHLFVASAGNSGKNTDLSFHFPAGSPFPNVVAVAATDRNDAIASFSNYGAASVDLAAPGREIYSTAPTNRTTGLPTYKTLNGTSMAAPHVTGAAALVRSQFPGLAFSDVKTLLLETVDLVPGLSNKTLAGGRLNIGKAQAALMEGAPFAAIGAVDDDNVDGTSGNGNGIAEPGETVDLALVFRNAWADPIEITGITASENSTFLSITQQPTAPFTIPPGESASPPTPLRLAITANATTPAQIPITLALTSGGGDAWVKQPKLGVYRIRTLSGTVRRDGVGVPNATVHFTAPLGGGTAAGNATGNYSFAAIDTQYSVFASLPNATDTAAITVDGATQTSPLDFSFQTRTISGRLLDAAGNPVVDGRTVFLFIDANQSNWVDRFTYYFEQPAQPDGSYSFTHVYGRSHPSTLYTAGQIPYWERISSFTLSATETRNLTLERSEITAFPSPLAASAVQGEIKNVTLSIDPIGAASFYIWHPRLQNGRRENGSSIHPSPGTPLRRIELLTPAGPRLDPDLPAELASYDSVAGKLYRSDGLRNEIRVFDLDTGALLNTWEIPNTPTTPIPPAPDPSPGLWYPTEAEIDRSTGWIWLAGVKSGANSSEDRGWLFAIDTADGTLKRSFVLHDQPVDVAIVNGALFCVIRDRNDGDDHVAEIHPTTGNILRQSTLTAQTAYRETTFSAPRKYLGSPEGLWILFQNKNTKTAYLDLFATTDLNTVSRIRRVSLGVVADLPGGPHHPEILQNAFFSGDFQNILVVEDDRYDVPPSPSDPGEVALREFRMGGPGDAWMTLPVGEGSITAPYATRNVTLQLRADRLTPGTYVADLYVDTNTISTPRFLVPLTFTVTSAAPAGYAPWASTIAWGGSDSSPGGDPNRNGRSNYLEYLLGRDPLAAGDPLFDRMETDEAETVLEFRRRKDADALTLQWSPDLAGWSLLEVDHQTVFGEILADDGTVETVRLRIPLDGDPRQFFRFEAGPE